MRNGISMGFTVLELLVVMTIMGIITTVLVSGFPRFGELLAVDGQAQLMTLAIRDLEQRAVSTVESSISPGEYKAAFGVHFNVADNKRYLLFSDVVTSDNFFTPWEEIEIIPIERGVHIRRICKLDSMGTACDAVVGDLEQLSVTYKRPNPIIEMHGATVTSCNPGPCTITPLGAGSYAIEIESKDGSLARRIIMWTTGAVAIKKVP